MLSLLSGTCFLAGLFVFLVLWSNPPRRPRRPELYQEKFAPAAPRYVPKAKAP